MGILEEDVREIAERLRDRLAALRDRTLLVAGGGGFLPSYLLEALGYSNEHFLDPPCRLICVDNFITGMPERLEHLQGRPGFSLIQHDLTAPLRLDGPVDYILHAASVASPPFYRKYPLETIDVNVLGTRNLLELARQKKVESFVYLSSSEVYGDPPREAIPTPETYRGNVSCTGPRACYDESKRLAETLCIVYCQRFGIPVKIVRPFNVYGPRLCLKDGRVIADFLKDALSGNRVTLYSDGQSTRSFCYVTDVVGAILLLLLSDHNGEVFNVGNDEEVSIESVAQLINALCERKPGIRFAKNADAHYLSESPRRRCPDLAKVKQAIPWQPVVNLRQGLRRTIQWYLDEDGVE